MKKNMLALICVMVLTLQASATGGGAHIGNGGGNGEMRALLIAHHLPNYLDVCLKNQDCKLPLESEVIQFVQQDNRKLKFINASEFNQFCDSEFIFISHESLYESVAAKNDNLILGVLLSSYTSCFNKKLNSVQVTTQLSPVPQEVIQNVLFNFSSSSGDTLYSKILNSNVDSEIKSRLGCHYYRLMESYENNVFLVKCLNDDRSYLMKVITTENAIRLKWKDL